MQVMLSQSSTSCNVLLLLLGAPLAFALVRVGLYGAVTRVAAIVGAHCSKGNAGGQMVRVDGIRVSGFSEWDS